MYNHAFGIVVVAGMSTGAACFDANRPTIIVNIFFNKLAPGTYKINSWCCYPVCCGKVSTGGLF